MNWIIAALKKYAVFTGRSRRKEYWMFTLFQIIALVLAMFLDNMLGTMFVLYLVVVVALLVPALAVTARRLHDTGRSAWWILIGLVPIIGGVVLLVFMCLDSEPGANKWGPNPKLETATVGNDALDGHMAR
jgi:uncharacterized membrane protein YhaH (DUF805 family)